MVGCLHATGVSASKTPVSALCMAPSKRAATATPAGTIAPRMSITFTVRKSSSTTVSAPFTTSVLCCAWLTICACLFLRAGMLNSIQSFWHAMYPHLSRCAKLNAKNGKPPQRLARDEREEKDRDEFSRLSLHQYRHTKCRLQYG